MLSLCGGRRFLLAGVLAVFGIVVSSAAVQGQTKLGGFVEVEQPFFARYARYNQLLEGAAFNETSKEDKGIPELAAKHFVYPLTWSNIQADKSDEGLPKIRRLLKDAMTHEKTLSGANKDFMKALAHELVVCFKQVLELPMDKDYPAVTSAGLMLQDFAKCRQPEVHDFLMQVTKPDEKDKKNPYPPFVRMCAVRALGEFSNPLWAPVDNKANATVQEVAAKMQRDSDRINRIGNFVAFPYVPQGDDEEHVKAYVFVRREGIKALAQSQVPAADIVKKKVHGPAAYYLLYIAMGGRFADGTPPLTLPEKVEAILGVCNLKLGDTPQYNAELGIYATALCLSEFFAEYNKDYAFFAKVKGGKDTKRVAPRIEEITWQTLAARLEDGLNALNSSLSPDSKKKLEGLKSKISTGASATALSIVKDRRDPVPQEIPQLLADYAASIRPSGGEVFSGVDDSPVLPLPPK
jgi:hypothetical protein